MSFDSARGSIAAYNAGVARKKAENACKTHCPAGHPYDDENTKERKGRRGCRECERLYQVRRYDEVRGTGPGLGSHNRLKTHCAKGHLLAGKNLKITKAGRRKCRICNNEWTRQAKRRSAIDPAIATPAPKLSSGPCAI